MANLYDPNTGLPVEIKQPWEELYIDMEFAARLRTGDTLSSVSEVVFENQGIVTASTDITLAESTVSGTVAQVKVSEGTDQENYKLTFRCVTVAGEKVEADGMLYVRD